MSEDGAIDMHAALAVPARARILDVVRDAGAPVTAQDLAEELGIHVTTVRFHLAQLERAGLVVSGPQQSGRRGRPRIGYRAGTLDPAEVHEQMIDALAEALTDRGSRDRALAAGRWWADRLPEPDGDPASVTTNVFMQLGFAPSRDGEVIQLRRCPFGEAARRTPEVVCRVHLGLAQGLVRRAAQLQSTDAPQVALIPFAEPGICLLTLSGHLTKARASA
ncbi:MAG: helix-turn-helix domain-containing protein [bacterium]|nr:helix-turn-helix domain-containing protein [bacterium]